MNDAQHAKLERLATTLGWEFFPIEGLVYSGTTLALRAVNTAMQEDIYIAVREDGSHKFYRRLTSAE